MTDGGGDTFLATIIEGHDTTVGQRQLYLSLTLLAGNLACHRAVDFVGQPVFTSHSLQLQHALEIIVKLRSVVFHILIMALHRVVAHDGLR